MNMIKRTFLAAMIGASLGCVTVPAQAAEIYVQIAPPAVRYEPVPPPRVGHIWVPGYWDWRNDQHVWVSGTFVVERPGYYYERPRWVEREGRWYLQRGDWRRGDRDGDGVPNSQDRRPDDPRRY